MVQRLNPRQIDAATLADGNYALAVAGGKVTGLTAAGSGGGALAVEDEGTEVVAAASRLNFTGAGVSAVDAGSGEVTVDIPGGSGGSTIKDRRWTPATGSTSIDEFNDESLSASWSRVDGAAAPVGNVTWTEAADVLSVRNTGGDTSGAIHALLRPIGTSMVPGDAFIASMRVFAEAANYGMGGLVLSAGNTYGSGAQLFSLHYPNGAALNNEIFTAIGFTGGTWRVLTLNSVVAGVTYHRLVCTAANTWRLDVSPDGVSWITGSAYAHAFTPTYVGFLSSSWGTAKKSVVSYEFLRRVAGVS